MPAVREPLARLRLQHLLAQVLIIPSGPIFHSTGGPTRQSDLGPQPPKYRWANSASVSASYSRSGVVWMYIT
ncbi:hypothetical protein ACWY4P_34985 [Streptomyces sp. LZ34]